MNPTTIATAAVAVGCTSVALWRWLRVSQREHYHPGRATSVAKQWWQVRPDAMAPLAIGGVFVGLGATGHQSAPALFICAAGIAALAPRPLALLKTDQKLAVTARVRRLIATLVALGAALLVIGPDGRYVIIAGLAAPLLVDLAALIMKPVEKSLAMGFVKKAHAKLTDIAPTTVALTGSYGKTTTKNYTAHLLAGAHQTLPTPGSFNNLMGLTRSVNEHMQPGTDVFVAEMGTYGPGEIKELCDWFTPSIAAIVSIGEAHLERMGSRETIVQAKSEILDKATVWVLNTDTPELADRAASAPAHVTVIRCSATSPQDADVAAITEESGDVSVYLAGTKLTTFTPTGAVHPINVAVAVAIAQHLAVPESMITKQLTKLPVVASRGITSRTDGGVNIIDDTFNSNPTGADAALAAAAAELPAGKTLWVVTPGMFELGSAMRERNQQWAEAVLAIPGAQLLGVGGTNKKAFAAAATAQSATDRYTWYGTRPAAVAYVMATAQPGDTVLYENDRPDHLP